MNSLLQSRLVTITSQSSIDALQKGNVVSVLKLPTSIPTYRVYLDTSKDPERGIMSTFYMSVSIRPGAVVKWSTRRDWLHPKEDNSGIMVATECAYDRREILMPGEPEYDELCRDLTALGLMR
jgi:hypothetical protein